MKHLAQLGCGLGWLEAFSSLSSSWFLLLTLHIVGLSLGLKNMKRQVLRSGNFLNFFIKIYIHIKQLFKFALMLTFLNRYCALISFTFFQYALCITAVSLFFVYYTTVGFDNLIKSRISKTNLFMSQSDGCALNKFFISINLILCILVSVVAILPKVQEHQPRSGLLQSSIVSLYTLYLTWSAMSNNPGKYAVIWNV